jgi:hypothetical protein
MVSFSFLVVCRPTYKGENKVEDFFRGVVNLQRVGDTLMKECTEEHDPAHV